MKISTIIQLCMRHIQFCFYLEGYIVATQRMLSQAEQHVLPHEYLTRERKTMMGNTNTRLSLS